MLSLLITALFGVLSEAIPDPTSPIITISMQNITVNYGQRVQLFCEAAGFPKPKVRIVKRPPKSFVHNEVDLNTVITPLETNYDIAVIKNMRDSDEGWYYCKAKNSHGTQMSRAYIGIRNKCASFQCPDGKVCEVDENTLQPICRCPTRRCMTMQLQPVCGTDCNTYFSLCYLEVQRCETGLNLTVAHSGPCRRPSPPTVDYWQRNVSVAQGGEIELNCFASGDPSPTVEWYHMAKEGEDPIKVANSDRLYIQAANLADSGFYFCQASTCRAFIAQSNTFRVRVSIPPVLPTCVLAGNGHVRTFDSQSYSFGGVCSYMMARDCSKTSWFVYSRFSDCKVKATCLEAITIYHKRAYFEIGRGWYVNLAGRSHFTMREHEERIYEDLGLQLYMNGTHIHADLSTFHLVWDGVSTSHLVLQEGYKNEPTCGLCGTNIGENSERSSMLGQEEALRIVVNSRLDHHNQCAPSYLQTYQCSAQSRSRATIMCTEIFSCAAFELCGQVVDIDWYMSTCIQDSCSREYLSSYPSPCRATAAFNEMCGVAGIDTSACLHRECSVSNVLAGTNCPEALPFRGCGPSL